ncbi:MAG: hypothetical protein EOP37_19610 [Rubrivivax sp.]|nr:MAG: hypothetical protein EOP37_19610 [Rubrivivax sp.]
MSIPHRILVWLTALAVATGSPVHKADAADVAQAHGEGTAAGQAANPLVRGRINTPNASALVPGYTTAPPERRYYGQPSLSGAADAQFTACRSLPRDPVCQALLGAQASANTPREPVSVNDPAVLDARRVIGDPSSQLGDIASYYSGCAAGSCPANVFCLDGNCFDTNHAGDADFARAMSLMEAAREAGVYLDAATLQVFQGEASRCRDRLLKNCCHEDSAGAGMSNQSMFGVGSRLVYDVLMNANNRQFLYQGMQALLMGGGFSGTFTTYGVTVAVNGAALPAGSAVLYSGQSVVVAFDPWSLAIAVVIYIVMSMMSCDEEEGKLAMKEGARLCHAVGTYCSSCIRVLGHCVSCTTHTTKKCCFNSSLARLINEQGRAQLRKGWGSAQKPDCSGFSVAQLQRMDFSKIDLTEFYASIVPRLPDAAAIQTRNATQAPRCYFGEGKCE